MELSDQMVLGQEVPVPTR